MKTRYFKLLFPALSMAVLGHADQPDNELVATILKLEGKIGKEDSAQMPHAKKQPNYYEYHNRVIVFNPIHQAYERIKPNDIYVGVEGYFAPIVNKDDNNWFLDAELRLGYNFFMNGRDLFTAFAGGGFMKDYWGHHHHHHHRKHKPGIGYGTVGFLYTHEVNTIFNFGLNAKFIIGGSSKTDHFNWGSPIVGADVALPITFRFGYHRHWDYRIEPFYIYLHGSSASESYVGFRNSIGYRF